MTGRSDDETVAGDCRRGEGPLVEGVPVDDLELRSRSDHERVPVLAEREDFSVVRPWRRRKAARLARNPLPAVDLLPGLRIVCGEEASIVQGVVVIAVDER